MKTNRKIKTKIVAFVIALFLVFIPALSFTKSVLAQASPAPFGGQIYWTQPCQCPIPGYLIWVGPPVSASVLYTSGSVLYPNFNLFTLGTWVLGLYTPMSVACGFYTTYGCNINAYGYGIIRIVGTS